MFREKVYLIRSKHDPGLSISSLFFPHSNSVSGGAWTSTMKIFLVWQRSTMAASCFALASGLLLTDASAVAQRSSLFADAPKALQLSGAVGGTHDPSIMKEGGTFYVFATGAAPPPGEELLPPAPPGSPGENKPAPVRHLGQLAIRCSPDLKVWRRCGAVFPDGVPDWIKAASRETKDLWAPDISFFDGLYHLYYAFSIFGKNTSGIALVTNQTLDSASPKYKWVDQGLVLQSRSTDDFNAIDPNLVLDQKGDPWLSFGSFWSGIKMRRLDLKTGKLSSMDTTTYSLASRKQPEHAEAPKPGLPPDTQAVEAPFILRHEGYFYLFVSWDLCCRGTRSTYRTMVGRSRSVTGPYLDRTGEPMAEGGGTELLTANSRWVGPGGESLLHLPDGGDIIVFHAYDAQTGRPSLQISTIGWKDGWPSAALEDSGR
jgi:arabinan endo-1,5-alpha-L-arabinosidase